MTFSAPATCVCGRLKMPVATDRRLNRNVGLGALAPPEMAFVQAQARLVTSGTVSARLPEAEAAGSRRASMARDATRPRTWWTRGQPAAPAVLVGASRSSTVLAEMVRLPPAARVISIRRGWVLGDAGMVTCRTPSA
jgi:hypothetical protein